jgi:hypothetical protein
VQRPKERPIPINLGDTVLANVAGNQGQKSSRANVTGIGNKHDPVSVTDSEAAGGSAPFDLLAGQTLGAEPFERHPAVGRGFRRGDNEGSGARRFVNPPMSFSPSSGGAAAFSAAD